MNASIIVAALVLLGLTLYCVRRDRQPAYVVSKTTLSVIFVVAALLQPHPVPLYFYMILAGLLFGLGGDFFLALTGKRMFLTGLISFLLGHILFTVAFFVIAIPGPAVLPGVLAVIAAGYVVFRWLRPSLGTMEKPVLVYIAVISIMLVSALAVLFAPRLSVTARSMIFTGAFLFYLSDLFVARNRFVKKEFLNRLIGLPLYYAGQFILAFSVGVVG